MNITLANDLIFTEINTIDVFDYTNGNFIFSLDELHDCSIDHIEESKPIRGRSGRIVSHIKSSKGVTISGTNGVVSSGLMSFQTGGTFGRGATSIMWSDYLIVQNNQAHISFRAIGSFGAEILSVVVVRKDGSQPEKFEQDTEVGDKKFTYTPYTKTLTFSGLEDGTDIVVHYWRYVETTTIANDSDKCSKQAMLYINGMAEDKCSNVYHVQLFFPRVDFSGEFTLDFSGSQTVHRFNATALTDHCTGIGSHFYVYNVFGLDSPDVKVGKYFYVDVDNEYYLDTDEEVYAEA